MFIVVRVLLDFSKAFCQEKNMSFPKTVLKGCVSGILVPDTFFRPRVTRNNRILLDEMDRCDPVICIGQEELLLEAAIVYYVYFS